MVPEQMDVDDMNEGMNEGNDAFLPPDAEHVAQQRAGLPLPPDARAGTDADHAYVKTYCTQCNAMGVDLWKTDFPDPEAEDFRWNPRDLPTYWG